LRLILSLFLQTKVDLGSRRRGLQFQHKFTSKLLAAAISHSNLMRTITFNLFLTI